MQANKQILVLNWKSFPSDVNEAMKLFDLIDSADTDKTVLLAPPDPLLHTLATRAQNVQIISQDLSGCDIGSYTAQASGELLHSIGIRHSIVGHSETRHHFRYNDQAIINKIHKAIQNDITPIICVGHEIEGEDLDAIVDEIQRFTAELPAGVQPWVALEPQWAITYDGQTNAANTDFIQTAVERVKQMTINGQHAKVLYGGSVNSSNINELNQIPKLDGYLIGTASYNWEELKTIIS